MHTVGTTSQGVIVTNTSESRFDGPYVLTKYLNGRPLYQLLGTAACIYFDGNKWVLVDDGGIVLAESSFSINTCPTSLWTNSIEVEISGLRINILRGDDVSVFTQVVEKGISPGFDFITQSRILNKGLSEIQRISVTADSSNINGFFILFAMNTSKEIKVKWNEEAIDLALKLEALPSFGKVVVERIKNPRNGYDWLITFASLFKNLPLLRVSNNYLNGNKVNVVVSEERKGKEVTSHGSFDDLITGKKYHKQVLPMNLVGVGKSSIHQQNNGNGIMPLSIIVSDVPAAPRIEDAWALSDSQIGLNFTLPPENGDPIKSFKLEWTSGDDFGTNKIFKIGFSLIEEIDVVGSFTLVVNQIEHTASLNVASSLSEIEMALNSLISVGEVIVNRSIGDGKDYLITFVQEVGNATSLDIDCSNLRIVEEDKGVDCFSEVIQAGRLPPDYG